MSNLEEAAGLDPNVDFLRLKRDLERVEESLTERLARIEAEANPSQDAITVAAVERMLASKHQQAGDEDIEDDFAGGTSGIDGAPTMTWRSHLAELVLRLAEFGYDKWAALLKETADVNSLKKPFTAADEANVIKSIRECLAAFKKEVSGGGSPSHNLKATAKALWDWAEDRTSKQSVEQVEIRQGGDGTAEAENAELKAKTEESDNGRIDDAEKRQDGTVTKSNAKVQNWALVCSDDKWWLFHYFPNLRKWCQRREVDLPKGRVRRFAEALINGKGFISKADAIAIFKNGEWEKRSSIDIFSSVCKPTRGKLNAAIREAIKDCAKVKLDGIPVKWDSKRGGWLCNIEVGTATPEDNKLTFSPEG